MSEIIMSTDSKSDALWHLADALSEDILNTGDDELFAEVVEDHQSRRALTTDFDRISWRSLRRVRRQRYVERLRQLIERPWPSARLATIAIATLAVIVFAVLSISMRRSGLRSGMTPTWPVQMQDLRNRLSRPKLPKAPRRV
jgi:hypothetical protein